MQRNIVEEIRVAVQKEASYGKAKVIGNKAKAIGNKAKAVRTNTRRRIRNSPPKVKKAIRMYTGLLGKTTLYSPIRKKINKTRRDRRASHNLNDRDIAIGMAQRYREGINPNMSNEELAREYERVQEAGAKGESLSAKEQAFFIEMQAVKAQLHLSDQEIQDAIIYGSGQNRRWRK